MMSFSNPEINYSKRQIVFHVDMDSFFASVEVREHPDLRGKALCVVMGFDPTFRRGVVSTCSYEARKSGVHSAMPVGMAHKLCPNCIFLPVNMELYKTVSSNVMSILRGFSEKFEQVSIDEAYLVPFNISNFEDAVLCAHKIKDETKLQEGITCSVGIGPNKLVAKIASGFQKPDGLTIVKPENVKDFLFPLPVSVIPYIGKKTTEALKEMGMNKVEDLANFKVQVLSERFGKIGILMKQRANGVDFEEVEEKAGVKSISRHITFDEGVDDPDKIAKNVEKLADSVHENLMENKYLFKTVTIVVRLNNFSTFTRAMSVPVWTSDVNTIKNTAMELIEEFNDKKLRLVGVGVTKLRARDEKQTLMVDF
jgi:DNA polymerase IV (DinB-like DNA polymerase)